MPWEKLAIGLLGVMVAIGGYTLKRVIDTGEQVAVINAQISGIVTETASIKTAADKLSEKVDGINTTVTRIDTRLGTRK